MNSTEKSLAMGSVSIPAGTNNSPAGRSSCTETILIVDDSRINQKLLSTLLSNKGYQVLTADSGVTGLQVLGENSPDLIILDVMMPKMDGYEFCRRIKNNARTRDIPVIFISSLDETEDKLTGFDVGGVDYITKPFHPREVLARISTHLKMCRLQRRLEQQNKQLEQEKQKSESLLLNVLPVRVARELIETGRCVPRSFDQVTVCFADIVEFTRTASCLEPEFLISELNEVFTAFDEIAGEHRCERMKTIGDAYLFACGVPDQNDQHAYNVVAAGLEMIDFLEERNRKSGRQWRIRVGVHTGKVVGGVVGTKKYLYDIFGDTVNIAARLEEHCRPMRVNVSETTYQLLKNSFVFSEISGVAMKGKGKQSMYFVEKERTV